MEQLQGTQSLSVSDEFAKVRAEGYSVELGDTLDKAWSNLVKPNLGVLIGYCLVAMVMIVASFFIAIIPIIGYVIILGFLSIVGAGFYTFFLAYHQRQHAEFSNFFDSFSYAMPLGLYGIVSSLLGLIPTIVIWSIGIAFFGGSSDLTNMESFFGVFLEMSQNTGFSLLSNVGSIISGLIMLLYAFAPLLIITNKMGFWEAMETSRKLVMSNYLGMMGFGIILYLINMAGALACLVGLLVTVPLLYACNFVLYTKLVEKNGGGSNFAGGFYADENAPLDVL